MFKFSDEEIKRLLTGIFNGSITERDLPESLYMSISEYLKEGLYSGFGISFNKLSEDINKGVGSFTKPDLELLTELRENIYFFSAAKTFSEVQDMSALLTGENSLSTFPEFKEAAMKIYETYNSDWLETEYNTSVGMAQSAVKWNQIEQQKDVLPLLKYSAIEDENTSDICAPLDGITLPVDDPFWDEYMPLNHFNCRCIVEQLDEGDITPKGEVEEKTEGPDENMNDIFKMNPGKDRVIFDDSHPYFDLEKKDRAFGERNFDLKIPDED